MKNKKREDFQGGLILVAIGLIFLLSRFINLGENIGLLILPVLGVGFMLWGIFTREAGMMIPGGILSGIGAGIYLQAEVTEIVPQADGALFLLAFGAGFASITLFSLLFARETHWWPLIPASIMVLIGLSIAFGGVFFTALAFAGKYWPLILIAVGAYSIYEALKRPNLKEKFNE